MLKALIIRPGALGDTLMLMPSIAQLQGKMETVLIGRYPGMDYLKPYATQSFNYECSGWHMLFSENSDKVNGLSFPQVDRLVAFLSDAKGQAACNLKIWFPSIPINIFSPFPSLKDDIHVAFYIARSLQKAGLPVDPRKTIKEAYQHPLIAGNRELSQAKRIVLHPGSGSLKKNYTPEFWIELIKALNQERLDQKNPIMLLLGPAEESLLPYFEENLGGLEVEISFCSDTEGLLSILSQANLYIGHDSGVTHLAAMLGIHVIALFKESSIQQWHPLGPCVKAMRCELSEKDFVGKIVGYSSPLFRNQI
jgi:ADP-heptose:LPS heptosyltransferase